MVCTRPASSCECLQPPQLTTSMDEGALRGLQRKESGGRLLPAGVVRVEGPFASHQAVKLVVRRRRRPTLPASIQLTASSETSSTSPPPSPRLADHSENVSPLPAPQPGTPNIQPALSLSSSIASLDPLSRSVPPSPAMTALSERLAKTTMEGGQGSVKVVHELAVARGERTLTAADEGDWEEVEVGKGLALYNSSEIDRIKGMKR